MTYANLLMIKILASYPRKVASVLFLGIFIVVCIAGVYVRNVHADSVFRSILFHLFL